MESTPSTTPTPAPTPDVWSLIAPSRRRLFTRLPTVITNPALRPPVLEEMQADINQVIQSLANKYTDHTCVQLHTEELVAEGQYKLAQLLHKGILEKQPTRLHFFKVFKTSVANHFRSLVQRFRFTHKRTGHAPPPRAKPGEVPRLEDHRPKTVELSLDDPDVHVQVSDPNYEPHSEQAFIDDCAALLNPVEKLVWRELTQPCALTHLLADLDSRRGTAPGDVAVKVIRHEHHAEALGLDHGLFKETVAAIKSKIETHRAMSTQDTEDRLRFNATVQHLAGVFGVQIPPNTDEMIIRRLFTIAARDQYQRLTPQLNELLLSIGAKPPRVYGDTLSCYGILYQRTHRKCMMCGLRQACAVEAANAGMGKITLSPHLLGAKSLRIPAVMPDTGAPGNGTQEAIDAEVVAYLSDTYEQLNQNGQIFYAYRDTKKRPLFLFCLEEPTSPIRLRFCNPSAKIMARLSGKRKSWYAPPGLSAQETIDLIEAHVDDVTRRALVTETTPEPSEPA